MRKNLLACLLAITAWALHGCAVFAGPDLAQCPLVDELHLLEHGRFREARSGFTLREKEPGAILALTLMSEWGVGAPAGTTGYRRRWQDLGGKAQEAGATTLVRCSKLGLSGADLLLGIASFTGIGLNPSLESSEEHFRTAQANGNALASIGSAAVAHASGRQETADELLETVVTKPVGFTEYSVGAAFYLGIIFKQDYVRAARWFRRAAEKGDARAQGTLGYMYALGRGVEKDDGQSEYWLKRQASNAAQNDRSEYPIIRGYWEGESP